VPHRVDFSDRDIRRSLVFIADSSKSIALNS
jgi:hypothetical protein